MPEPRTPWPRWFAYLQLFYGAPLLILGVVASLVDGHPWRLLTGPGFPFFTLAAIHLSVAWVWFRRSPWFRLPLLASLIAWPTAPFWLAYVPHTPMFARGLPGAIGIGAVPGHVLLVVLGIVFAGLCLYLLQFGFTLYVLIRRKARFAVPSEPPRYTLRPLLTMFVILAAALGLDWRIPSERMREQDRRTEERRTAPERAARSYVDAVLSDDTRAIETKIEDCRALDSFAPIVRHADKRVREAAVNSLADGTTIQLSDSERNALLEVVQDEDEEVTVRRTAVKSIALDDFHRGNIRGDLDPQPAADLDRALSRIARDNAFVIEELIAVVTRDASPYTPPTNAVRFLEAMGPQAADAVPALMAALEHENQWYYAPAVADALGAIGPAAEPALPALQRKTEQRAYPELRDSAKAAIEKIRCGDPSQVPPAPPAP